MQGLGHFFEASRPFFCGLWSFLAILVWCSLGERLIDEFYTIKDATYECQWYSYSIEVQRIIQLIIVDAQEPKILKGFGNISSSHETYKKVINISISFMFDNHKKCFDF